MLNLAKLEFDAVFISRLSEFNVPVERSTAVIDKQIKVMVDNYVWNVGLMF